MSLKVYIAAPYVMKDAIVAEAAELAEDGIEVTSSWIKEPHKPTTQMVELTPAEHRFYALQDIEDVLAADFLIFHTDPTKTLVRAGRHVEFGMVVAINRLVRPVPIFVVGNEYENIFHHLPNIRHFPDWPSARAELVHFNQWKDTVGSAAHSARNGLTL